MAYTYHLQTGTVTRDSDGAIIQPQTCTDEDFLEYQAWLATPGVELNIIDD